jgi:hypothetical protein
LIPFPLVINLLCLFSIFYLVTIDDLVIFSRFYSTGFLLIGYFLTEAETKVLISFELFPEGFEF